MKKTVWLPPRPTLAKALSPGGELEYRSSPSAKCALTHHFTKPYRPQTNGKAERFIQTITREWAYARPYDSSDHRASFLNYYLHDYNFHRPHSALNSLPPSSRLPKTADNLSRINS
jgi:transposase InsO family protein